MAPKRKASAALTPTNLKKDIRDMLYGFGDEKGSLSESVDLLEAIVVDYIKDLCSEAMDVAIHRNSELTAECFAFTVRKDARKFNRISELLSAHEEFKKTTQQPLAELGS